MILDVGCGLRPYEDCFPLSKYIGIDVPVSGREASGKSPDYEFDGTNIPLESEHFDVVICTEVLEHAENPDLLLKEMARVTQPGGVLFLTVPFIWGLHELPYDFRRFTTEGIRKAVEKAGYEVIKQEKLTIGLDAVRLLVASEINNFLKHHVDHLERKKMSFRLMIWLQDWLFRILTLVWRRSIRFERIYIDNLIHARKV